MCERAGQRCLVTSKNRNKDKSKIPVTKDAITLQRSIANLEKSAKNENVYINELAEINKNLKTKVDSTYEKYTLKKQRKNELSKQTNDERGKIEILRNFIEAENKKVQTEKNKIDILKQNILEEKQELIDITRTHKAQMMEMSKQFQDMRHLHRPHILTSEVETLGMSNEDIKKIIAKKKEQLAGLRNCLDNTKDDYELEFLKTVLEDKQAFEKRITKEIETNQNIVNANVELRNKIEELKNKM